MKILSSALKKPILYGFLAGTATLAAYNLANRLNQPNLSCPKSLWLVLSDYGFKDAQQKQAIEFLLQKSGITDISKLLKHEEKSSEDVLKNIIEFVELTQKHFTIRTGTQERWDVKESDWMKLESDQPQILEALKKLGITNEVLPAFHNRDVICVLGARKSAMKIRLIFAENLYAENKLSSKELALLAGERYITFDKNGVSIDGTKEELSTLAKKLDKPITTLTETDLIQSLYEQYAIKLKKLPVTIIDTPKGDLPRPTTETTVLELINWLKTHPEFTLITFVSNQPHVEYQKAVIAKTFRQNGIMNIKLEFIGPEFSPDIDPAVNIKNLIGAVGSQIYATTPTIVEKYKLLDSIHDEQLKKRFEKLYKTQQLTYKTSRPSPA